MNNNRIGIKCLEKHLVRIFPALCFSLSILKTWHSKNAHNMGNLSHIYIFGTHNVHFQSIMSLLLKQKSKHQPSPCRLSGANNRNFIMFIGFLCLFFRQFSGGSYSTLSHSLYLNILLFLHNPCTIKDALLNQDSGTRHTSNLLLCTSSPLYFIATVT